MKEREELYKILEELFEETGDPLEFQEKELENKVRELYKKDFGWLEYSIALDGAVRNGIVKKAVIYYT